MSRPDMQRFEAAPWSTALKVVSILAMLILCGVTYGVVHAIPRGTRVPFAATFGTMIAIVPVAILAGSILFIVSGYDLDRGHLYVQRPLWRTRIPLDGLRRAWHDPNAMKRSLRIFGNGGLFSITGLYQNATLGRYRAFVTDPKEAVVLQFAARTIVVSPAHPRAFLGELHLLRPEVSAPEPAKTVTVLPGICSALSTECETSHALSSSVRARWGAASPRTSRTPAFPFTCSTSHSRSSPHRWSG